MPVNTKEVEEGLQKFRTRANAALDMYAVTAALKLQSEAQQNRPWTDRTNRARLGLTGSSESTEKELRIVLAHTVDYGVWLELAHEQNYAIIMPTMNAQKDGIIQGLQGLLDKIRL